MMTDKKKIRKEILLPVLLLAIVIFLVYSPAFKSGFIPWDDKEYTIENADIKSFSKENIKNIFSKSYLGNYQPATMLSYSCDFSFGGEKPFVYHFTNLLFHFLNCVLVFLLLKKIIKKKELSFLGALIFALHPTQAESVMWIAERKNLLSVFFFLLASLHYFNYKESSKLKFYLFSFLFFGLALMSKATAVAFPLCLIAFDLMRGEKIPIAIGAKKNILEKIPFFIFSLIMGILAVHFQKKDGFLNSEHDFNFFTKILYGAQAFCFYIFKTMVPVSLSSYYPYPDKTGLLQFICLGIVLLVAVGIYFLLKKKRNIEAGGILFFVFNIIFVLQFIPFGEALVAERYNYAGSIGLILFFVVFFGKISGRFLKNNLLPKIIAGIILVIFSSLSFIRSKTWENNFVFYEDILKKFPDSYIVLSSLGAEYMKENKFDKAEEYFEKSIAKNPKYYSVYYNRGLSFLKQGKTELAYDALSTCIEIKSYSKALFVRATILEQAKQFERAIQDLDIVLKEKPENAKAFYLRALCKDEMGKADISLEDYNTAIKLLPNEPLYYLNRAIAFGKLNRIEESISDLNKAINLKPDYAQAFYLRAIGKNKKKESPCEDLKRAYELGSREAGTAMEKICK